MWKKIAKRRQTRSLAALSAGDVEVVLEQFAADVQFVFVGDSSLGTELGSKEDVRRWFGRLFDANEGELRNVTQSTAGRASRVLVVRLSILIWSS